MRLARDEENCFRVAEIGIPNYSDVVVLGKPQLTLGNNADGNDLIIAPLINPRHGPTLRTHGSTFAS